MFILTYLMIFVILFYVKTIGLNDIDKSDDNDPGWGLFLSVSQGNDEYPSYNIGHLTQQLHLQQCVFVEIGEEFCALFVELRNIPRKSKIADSSEVGEFFLGLCKCATVRSWILCSDQLMRRRKSDCIFTEAIPSANTSARVHRRLCDVTLLTEYAKPCNCSIPMANQQLYPTEGFPTCFRTPLSESLCSPRGVCGVAECCATTIKGIHSPQCDPECHEKQPFCEEFGPWTSIPPEITSAWSHWSTPICENSDGRIFATATAICRNQLTGKSAIDCIGPGSFCCPADTKRCTCIVRNEDGILKATRVIESAPCLINLKKDSARSSSKTHSRHQKNHQSKYRSDHLYQENLGRRVRYLSDIESENPRSPLRRRLMFSSYDYLEEHSPTPDTNAELAFPEAQIVAESDNDNADNEDNDDTADNSENDDDHDTADNDDNDDNDDSDNNENDDNDDNDDYTDDADNYDTGDNNEDDDQEDETDDPNEDDDGELNRDEDDDSDDREAQEFGDYDDDSPDDGQDRGHGDGDNDLEISSLAVTGRILPHCLYYFLLTYICIAPVYLI
ncbi:uncharacterized protein LOC107219883 isoform X1 [Neodiprion lecontei]|uniref:Uncharacterized protein LOC107219883 isoform X1 n=1 Tax=Neodiprion lecontei TaxID=441921 RepID=A0ABM3FQW0_NEOLC|nr:uncharacterized protein LOC107219883 isoform X1 [Neodiprion lecontei]